MGGIPYTLVVYSCILPTSEHMSAKRFLTRYKLGCDAHGTHDISNTPTIRQPKNPHGLLALTGTPDFRPVAAHMAGTRTERVSHKMLRTKQLKAEHLSRCR